MRSAATEIQSGDGGKALEQLITKTSELKKNTSIIILIRNITAFQHIIEHLRLLILDVLFININLKLYAVIVLVAQVMLLHNITANPILMIKNQD